jgi:hypothetical protein
VGKPAAPRFDLRAHERISVKRATADEGKR